MNEMNQITSNLCQVLSLVMSWPPILRSHSEIKRFKCLMEMISDFEGDQGITCTYMSKPKGALASEVII